MGLFDKKFCDFCGNKIGLLGNKKLEDANMCKDCASKLSPWFNERRHSTKADIDRQLEYREQNKAAVASFTTTQSLGRTTKLLIDDNNKKFMVTSASDLSAANPDVLDYSQALGCDLDVKESRNELRTKDANGQSVSYNPPRYEYSYDFHVIIHVNHPYFDEMKFSLSNGSIKVGEQPMNPGQSGGWSVSRSGFSLTGNKIDQYYECVDMGNQIKAAIDAMRTGGNVTMSAQSGQYVPNQGMPMQGGMQMTQGGYGQPVPMQGGMPLQPGMHAGMGAGIVAGMAMQQGMPQQGYPQQGYPQQQMAQNFQNMQQQQAFAAQQAEMQALANDPQALAQRMQQAQQEAMRTMQQQGMGAAGMGMGAGMGLQQGMPMQQGYPQQPMAQNFQNMQQAQQQAFAGQQVQQNFQNVQQAMGGAGMQVTCPACQATTTVGPNGCCEFCGNKIM